MRKVAVIVCLLVMTMGWAEEAVRPMRVGMLLPLQADVSQRDQSMDRFVDFYTGALIAVYEQQAQGRSIEVHTYDIGKSVHLLENVLASGRLDSMDMVIGPVYPAQVRYMATWTLQHHVYSLLPFAYDVPELMYNPYLLQFNPSEALEAEVIVHSIESRRDSVGFVFVSAEESSVPQSVKALKHCVEAAGIAYVFTSVDQILADSLSEVLSDTLENILVMNTERYTNVRQVMSYLERAAQGKRLTLLTRYAWQDEPIILPQLYTTMFREDVEIDEVEYGRLYSRYIKKERVVSRPCYDLLGYDIMMYAIETIGRIAMGEDKEEVIGNWYMGLQSDIHFVRADSLGGYQNTNIHIVRKQ